MSAVDYFAPPHGAFRAIYLQEHCREWVGTPFRKHSCVKGRDGGVDCEWFIPSVLRASGAISSLEFAGIVVPAYELNHAEHSGESLFHEWFRQPGVRARVRAVDEAEPHLDGDFVFPVVGRCEHHIGFRIGSLVWHVARPSGVCAMTVSQLRLHRSRYRLLESSASYTSPVSSASS